jgi:hypothetical protein
MFPRALLLLALLPLVLASTLTFAEADVKGSWHTEREGALVAAKKKLQPILAVAMDHA